MESEKITFRRIKKLSEKIVERAQKFRSRYLMAFPCTMLHYFFGEALSMDLLLHEHRALPFHFLLHCSL